jgi:hypothetical protein
VAAQGRTSWTRLAPTSMASVSLSSEKPEMRMRALAAVNTNSSSSALSAAICESRSSPFPAQELRQWRVHEEQPESAYPAPWMREACNLPAPPPVQHELVEGRLPKQGSWLGNSVRQNGLARLRVEDVNTPGVVSERKVLAARRPSHAIDAGGRDWQGGGKAWVRLQGSVVFVPCKGGGRRRTTRKIRGAHGFCAAVPKNVERTARDEAHFITICGAAVGA